MHSSPDLKLRAEAEQEYKLAVAANGTDEKALTRLGDMAADKGDFDALLRITSRRWHWPRAMQTRRWDSPTSTSEKNECRGCAASCWSIVVAADPTNVLAHYRLSTVYRKLNRPEDAKRELEQYQKYKDIKEKLRTIYKDMRLDTPQDEPDK